MRMCSSTARGLTAIIAIATAVVLLASNFTIINAQQSVTSQPSAIENGITTAATTFQSTNDSFSIQVPDGWVIQDLNNTGSALLNESSQGYGILAQLCPEEEQQGAPPTNNASGGSSTDSTSNSCRGSQEEVIYIIRYPDLDTRIQAASNVTTTASNNNITTDNVQSYHLQKLQEVGYRSPQILNSTEVRLNLTNPQTNETITTVPAKFVEIAYSTNSAPNETRIGYFISTATNATAPNLGTTKGYAVFYEGNSTTNTAAAEITTATAASGSLAPTPLPPVVGQVFDSFELIAAPEVAQPIAPEVAQPIAPEAPVGQTEGEGEEGDAACDSSYPDFCIPPSPPDLNCDDVDGTNFKVLSPDPHGFDRDNDGIGCESGSNAPDDSGGVNDENGGGAEDGGDGDGGDDDEDGGSSGSTDSSTSSSSGSSRCPNGYHRSPSGDCERVTDTRGMPRCPNGYHRSPDGDCESVG